MYLLWLTFRHHGAVHAAWFLSIVDEIAEEVQGKAKVGKVNVDEQGDLASQFGVMSIPTIMVFKNGEAVATSVGAKSKAELLALLD